MNQCVPSWDLDEPHNSSGTLPLHPPPPGSTAAASPPHASSWKKSGTEYEVAELTWVNGLPSMNGLDQICTGKLNPKSPPPPWEKGGGTLESIIDQATGSILLPANPQFPSQPEYDLVPWIAAPHQRRGDEGCSATTVTTTTATAIMDALVPCSMTLVGDEGKRVPDPEGRCKRARAGGEGNCSVRESAASMDLRKDTCEVNGGQDVGFTTSTSPLEESRETEDASCRRPLARAVHERDSASQSRHSKGDGVAGEKKQGAAVRSSVSTKRSRVAAVHNQSERTSRSRKGQNASQPPYFDGEDYTCWKRKMMMYLKAMDEDSWTLEKKEYKKPDSSEDLTPAQRRKIVCNAKAMNALYCTLLKEGFNRVSTSEMAHEIWKSL